MDDETSPTPHVSGPPPIESDEGFQLLRKLVDRLLGPYAALQQESIQRVIRLLSFAQSLEHELHVPPPTPLSLLARLPELQAEAVQEMLRAAVVLTHAYLEDYLRTIAEALLPEANEDVLNAIPLVGLPGRPDKFLLGKLVRHKGKRVEEVLRESVRDHLYRTTFNNQGDIRKLLVEALGFELSRYNEKDLEIIQELIQRRHQIVHRADKVKVAHSETPHLQPIKSADASRWLIATREFMESLNGPLLEKLIDLEKNNRKTAVPK